MRLRLPLVSAGELPRIVCLKLVYCKPTRLAYYPPPPSASPPSPHPATVQPRPRAIVSMEGQYGLFNRLKFYFLGLKFYFFGPKFYFFGPKFFISTKNLARPWLIGQPALKILARPKRVILI